MEHDLHVFGPFGDTLLVRRSDIGARVWTRKILVLQEEVNRKVDGTYMHIVTHAGEFWVVRGTIVHHVAVMRVPQCTLGTAVPDSRRYIPPLDLDLAGTGNRWDLKKVMDINEYRKGDNVTTWTSVSCSARICRCGGVERGNKFGGRRLASSCCGSMWAMPM